MYKLSIINKEVSGCAYFVDSLYLWHAKLGHLNFKYLKFMSKHDMISYKHDDKETFFLSRIEILLCLNLYILMYVN